MSEKEIFSYLKNSKINPNVLKKICYYFSKDYTAIQTSKLLSISRQTVNSYFKILRNLLLQKQDELTYLLKKANFCYDHFFIQYIKSGSHISYFLLCNKKIFILHDNQLLFPNIQKFIQEKIEGPFSNNKKINSAKVLFNKKEHKYLLLHLNNQNTHVQEFIQKRLKKFRGLNPTSLQLHLKESQFRYNYSEEFLYSTLLSLLNLSMSKHAA